MELKIFLQQMITFTDMCEKSLINKYFREYEAAFFSFNLRGFLIVLLHLSFLRNCSVYSYISWDISAKMKIVVSNLWMIAELYKFSFS